MSARCGARIGADMILNLIWIVTAAVVGFLMGRLSMYRKRDMEETEQTEETVQQAQRRKPHGRHGRGNRQEEETGGWSVGSPVSGEVTEYNEGEHPTVVIHTDGNRLYAPTGGKITRLFPMGNAMLFTTEFGAELYIQAGKTEDELLNRYYRPKIVQNEVVGKGKLLLEFDRQGLEAEGISPDVSVCVEHYASGGAVRMTTRERVKTGEEILRMRDRVAFDA